MFESVPTLVDRVEETGRITKALEEVVRGRGQFVLFRGEGGCGKTRLVQEAITMAEERGFAVGFSTALAESFAPYQPWRESLSGLGLAHVLDDLPPPRLLGLYLFARDHRLVAKAEREALPDTVMSALTDAVRGAVKEREATVEGPLTMCSFESCRILVHRADGCAAAAVVQGNEDEALLSDLRELAEAAKSSGGLTGTANTEASGPPVEKRLRGPLDSGRYEGIDYVKDDPKLRQQRLFDRAAMGLARRSGTRPVVLAFDDLQWGDPSSLALLHYVSRNTREAQVLLLGSHRVEETGVRPHLKEALQRMEKEGLMAEVPLGGLAREDIGRLAKSFLGSHALPEEFLDLLWRETQGYPLFVREVLTQLEEEKAIETRGASKRLVRPLEQLSVPHRVREVIRARIDRLPKADRELLGAAATCGTRFTAAFVAKVVGEEAESVSPNLENLARIHGLLRPTENGYAFNHPSVREVAYAGLPSGVKENYHRDAARWLELVGGPIEDIAEHYYRARDGQAARRLRDAAEASRSRFANAEAIRFYSELLEVENESGPRAEAFEALGSVCMTTGDYEKAESSYRQAVQLTEDRRKSAELLAEIGLAIDRRGRYDSAMETCAQALGFVRGEGCREEALALHAIGLIHEHKGDYSMALERAMGALAIREKIGDQAGIAASLNNIGIVYRVQQNTEKALECLNRSVEISSKTGHLPFLARHLSNIGLAHLNRGDFNRALENFEQSLSINEKIGEQRGIAQCWGNIAIAQTELGEYGRALESHEKSIAIFRRLGDSQGIGIELLNAGDLCVKTGEYERAIQDYEKSLDIFRRIGAGESLATVHVSLAEANLLRGDLDKASDFANLALSMSADANLRGHIAETRKILGTINRERGKWKESAKDFEESILICREIDDRPMCGKSHLEFGLMWKKRGDLGTAEEHLGKALGIFEELKMPKEAEKARKALAELSPKGSSR